MNDQQGSQKADPNTTTTTIRISTPTITKELYEAGFSTLGNRPTLKPGPSTCWKPDRQWPRRQFGSNVCGSPGSSTT